MTTPSQDSAASALEEVREGGSLVTTMALMRLDEAVHAIRTGRFSDARRMVGEAMHKVNMLAAAQETLGVFAAHTGIMRAADLHEGVHILDWGIVESIERTVHKGVGGSHEHIVIHLEDEDEPRELSGHVELLVTVDE